MVMRNLIETLFPTPRLGIRPDANAGVPESGGETIVDVLARSSERADQEALEYVGVVTPHEAARLMHAAGARLVDVRTPGERLGAERVRGSLAIPWRGTRDPRAERRFFAQLRGAARREDIVLFLSANGERSHEAARAAARRGYVHALSVVEGYEGERVGAGRTRGGWRRRGPAKLTEDPADAALDEALEETFPASDPVAVHPASRGRPARD